jgi:hypothetical protein
MPLMFMHTMHCTKIYCRNIMSSKVVTHPDMYVITLRIRMISSQAVKREWNLL